jgi:hypothetical protein
MTIYDKFNWLVDNYSLVKFILKIKIYWIIFKMKLKDTQLSS